MTGHPPRFRAHRSLTDDFFTRNGHLARDIAEHSRPHIITTVGAIGPTGSAGDRRRPLGDARSYSRSRKAYQSIAATSSG
jgi:hypothetical protein